jgi:phosphate transport system protein
MDNGVDGTAKEATVEDHRSEPRGCTDEHPHIVEAYERELAELRGLFLKMGELAHGQVLRAIDLLTQHDKLAAERVIKDDDLVDDLAERIQKMAFQLLALRQPASGDLRFVLVLYKTSSNLERIADYAANIAKRSTRLDHCGGLEFINSVSRLGKMTRGLVHDVLAAFQNRDAAKALEVRDRDAEVDALYISLVRELLTYMMEDHGSITRCAHILFVIRNFERIGDHATDIAEHIHFLLKGEMPTGRRHKLEEWIDVEDGSNRPEGKAE